MTKPLYQSRYDQPDTLNWGRICGIAFAVTVQALIFMMLLVPPAVEDTKAKEDVNPATIIEPPPKKEKPPEIKPEPIKTPPPKDIPPPPKIDNPPPPPPTPPVILNVESPMSPPAPPPAPPSPPPVAQTTEASVDLSYQSHNPPDYPREELNAGVTGTVVLLVTIDAGGNVLKVDFEKRSGNRNLDRSAQDAARKWRFNAGMKDGVRVGGVARVFVEFKL